MAGAIGCAAAIDCLDAIGVAAAAAHEHALLEYGTRCLSEVPGLRIIGIAPHKVAILSFVLDGPHPQYIGSVFDKEGIPILTDRLRDVQGKILSFRFERVFRRSINKQNRPT